MARVAFENVVKKYGDVTAVNNLNIDVADKGIPGARRTFGCGKTTALRCLAGLEEITSGDIKIADRVVNDVAPKDRDIAMVFQSCALSPLSVYDNMAFGLKLRKVPKDEIKRRVGEAADILGIRSCWIASRASSPVVSASAWRLDVPSCASRRSSCSTNRFPTWMQNCAWQCAEISKLHQRLQTTFIYVTHDQTEAMTMATRIAVINKGVLQQLDSPQMLYDHPNNLFVAGFIGSPP